MYLHIGGEYTLPCRFIIGILNLETVKRTQKDILKFLSSKEKNDKAEFISEEIPRSVVITEDRIYYTPISTITLQKRLNNK